MAQPPTHHHKADTTANPLPVTPRPVPSLCQTESSPCLWRPGQPRSAQIRRLIRQCRRWLIEHRLSFHQTHSAAVKPPLQVWVALELRNASDYRRARRVSFRSREGSGPIVIPEIIELEVLQRGMPW
jgi:hypothetical protein